MLSPHECGIYDFVYLASSSRLCLNFEILGHLKAIHALLVSLHPYDIALHTANIVLFTVNAADGPPPSKTR